MEHIVGGLALFTDNVEKLYIKFLRTLAPPQVEISIRDARGLFAWTIGTGQNRGRGFSVGGVEVEIVVSKKGDGLVKNCKGELMFARSPAFANKVVHGTSDQTFSLQDRPLIQQKLVLEFEIPVFRYEPDGGRIRVVCDDFTSDAISIPRPNMLPPTPPQQN